MPETPDGHAPQFDLTIGGAGAPGASDFEVVNPATEAVIARAPAASRAQVDQAVAAARQAFPGWRDTPIAERQAKVAALAQVVEDHVDELKRLLTAEQGKPLDQAAQDILNGAGFCRDAAAMVLPVETHEDSAERLSRTLRVPIGVVAAIAPWNVPIALALWKVGPALVAGNTVILKPSPFTPLTTLRIGALVRDLLPTGVLNVLSGGDELGPWITAHPGIDKISFTGSSATGRKVMVSASENLKRLTLELGGNDAAIVLPGVDIPKVAEQLFAAAFYNSGQICAAAKRIYIHEDIYPPFAAALADLARTARIGDGAEQGVQFGPVQNRVQYERVKALLADCRAQGHRFLVGQDSAVPAKGYFIPLTIVDDPPADSRIVREEQFGPVLPLVRFRDADEALRLANESEYGLGGSVWGPPEAAAALAQQLDTGMVWVNEIHTVAPGQPFGGHKASGIGVANGLAGLLEYTNPKVMVIARQG